MAFNESLWQGKNSKFEYRNAKQILMTKKSNHKQYDLLDIICFDI